MLGRLVTDSKEVVNQKCRVLAKTYVKYMIFIEILADIPLRISVDLQNYTDRREVLCSIDWQQIQRDCVPKIGVWAEKPYKINNFHTNSCKHSLHNLR